MKRTCLSMALVLGLILSGLIAVEAGAFEILTKKDFSEEVIRKEDLIKTADNAIILFDASGSMAKPYKDTGMTRYDAAVKMLKDRNAATPELDWNIGMYLYTPWKEIHPIQRYNREKFAQSMNNLPAKPGKATFLQQGLIKTGKILESLSGRTVVFVYTDGDYTKISHGKRPDQKIKELSAQYDVCFYFISTADDAVNEAILKKASDLKACSRVIPFEAFLENPSYNSGALYMVKSSVDVITRTEENIVGAKIGNVLFDFNKAEIRDEFGTELDELGGFLKKNPKAYAVLAGFTDNVGSEEYNLGLSEARARSVAEYVAKRHDIAPERLVLHWFGKANPAADNDTEEGRGLNRRVEIAIGLQ